MKKILFLLLFFTGFLHAQILQNPTYGNTTTNTLKIKTPVTVTSVNFLSTNEADGSVNKIAPINITIPYTPVNYSISNQSIGQHLTGIDTRLGQISSTTAGITQRVYFTADNTTVNSVTYFASSLTGKGSAATGSPPALVLGDNTKAYFTKDVISIAQPSATIAYGGTYSGNLTVSATPTPVATQQRFTVEIYRTNNLGVPIASGVSGAPTGDLGVTVLAILDSGIINLSAGSITNVPVSGILTQNVTINTGERIRYHVSAAKIGTGGGNVTFGVYYGTSYNSYYDVPVAITTDAVLNKSTILGVTSTDALNNLYNAIDFPNTAYVTTNGNNSTAQLGNIKRPFLTIDAALDALPSTGGVIRIGVGSFLSPTNAKIKNNTKFIGSGKPFPDMSISYIDEVTKPTITSPTKLVGGTILQNTFDFSFKNNIEIRNLGVDVGKTWIDANNAGVPKDGLVTMQNVSHPNNNISPPTLGLVIDNVSSLNYSAAAAAHCILIENTVDAKISNISSYYGLHGVVIKSRGTNVNNVESYGHDVEGFIVKADTYAYSGDINISNVYISSIGTFDGSGFMIDGGTGNLKNINISNLHTEFCKYGFTAPNGVADKVNIVNSTLYKSQGNAFFMGPNVKNSNISNIHIDGTVSGNNFEVITAPGGSSVISNITSENSSQNGISLNATYGNIIANNVSSKNNSTNITVSGNVYGYGFKSPTAIVGSLFFDSSSNTDKVAQINSQGIVAKSSLSLNDFVLKSGDTMTGDLITTGVTVKKGSSNTIGAGSNYLWSNNLSGSSERNFVAQMNASNGIDYWIFNGSSWVNTGAKINSDGTISAQPATSGLQVVNFNQLNAAVRPYKVYTVNLSCSGGTSATLSIANVFENTLGVSAPTITTVSNGSYDLTFSSPLSATPAKIGAIIQKSGLQNAGVTQLSTSVLRVELDNNYSNVRPSGSLNSTFHFLEIIVSP